MNSSMDSIMREGAKAGIYSKLVLKNEGNISPSP
jgi:hypothetical protein